MASVRTDELDLAALSLNIINDLNVLGHIGDIADVGGVGDIGFIDLNYGFLCSLILTEGNSQRESHQEGEEHNSTGCFAHG